MMLDKLESEWAEVNKKLPPSIEEACQAVDHIQVCYHYWSSVILLNLHLLVIMRFRYGLNE